MNKNLLKLDYDKIINILSSYCITHSGKKLCDSLILKNKSSTVQYLLNQTSEAFNLLTDFGNAPIFEFENIDILVKTLKSNLSLSNKGLLDIAHILKTSRELKNYFNSNDIELLKNSKYPIMNSIFEELYSNIGIEKIIFDSIIDENNISDNASKNLFKLRKTRKFLEANIKEKLNLFIHSATYSKFIMEPIITIRNERYVIPVKIEYKDNIKGLIHDMSFSGSTVYLEPISIFDINNQINNIKSEEKKEIEKILEDLSKLLIPLIENLIINSNCIGKIDFCFAKAKFSKAINGVSPLINNKKFINLIDARHPLIDENNVVPISINLGMNFKSLVITGPNTGGKTVALKTVGLLCLMAYSGLHIPAKENSSIFVFDKIFADIGDEQSISESLSTFSSHMLNIIDITNSATENSLILVDELGSGTDPIQGASLAISILEYFYNIGCLSIATTHYSEIKNYALITNGFENASSEFDIINLRPTYRLIIGVPGKSNAFEISKRLGLSEKILERAKNFLTDANLNIEELLKTIYDSKIIIEKEKEEIQKNSNQITGLRKSLDNEYSVLKCNEKEILDDAKLKAKDILSQAKKESDEIIKDLNKIYDTAESQLYLNLNNPNVSSIKDFIKNANSKRNNLNEKVRNLSESLAYNNFSDEKNSPINPEDIKIGMDVFFTDFNTDATILTYPNKSGDIQIQIGSAKMNVNINKLQKTKKEIIKNNSLNKKNITNSNTYKQANSKSKYISPELNVIGQNVEEAIFVIDKYLDDCAISNLHNVRIVHGKGTGKLRNGIHTFLKTHPHVKTYRIGSFGEGEMGVTIVELK